MREHKKWDTASKDIKPLREQVEKYLKEMDWNSWEQAETIFVEMDNALYNNAVNTARKMKSKGFLVGDISEISGLSAEEILKM